MGSIFRKRRNKGGKLVVGKVWHARYRDGNGRCLEVSLKVSDKQVAQAKLHTLVREVEQESVGFILTKPLREAAQRPLKEHLADHVRDLIARGRNAHYVGTVEFRLAKLQKECGWITLREITAPSFTEWRTRQKALSAKTLKEYLAVIKGFLKWMEWQGHISENPLRFVQRVETRGHEKRGKRAFTDDELQRLFAVAGKWLPLYKAAVLTGIRDGELQKLQWVDLKLDGDPLTVTVRAAISKNKRTAMLPLHPKLAEELRELRATSSSDFVFAGLKCRWEIFEKHLKAAGIPKRDSRNLQVSFHALRHTYCTHLNAAGVSPAVAMELMRHSDPRLTAKVYTDASQLPLIAGMDKLLKYHEEKKHTKTPVPLVKTGQNLSLPVISNGAEESEEKLVLAGVLSSKVTSGPDEAKWEEWLQRKDSNLQHFG